MFSMILSETKDPSKKSNFDCFYIEILFSIYTVLKR